MKCSPCVTCFFWMQMINSLWHILVHHYKTITIRSDRQSTALTSDRSVEFNDKFVKSSKQGHFMLAFNASNTLRKPVLYSNIIFGFTLLSTTANNFTSKSKYKPKKWNFTVTKSGLQYVMSKQWHPFWSFAIYARILQTLFVNACLGLTRWT